MKKYLVRFLALSAFLILLIYATGCDGGDGSEGTSNSPKAANSNVGGASANYTETNNEKADGKTYQTPEPATLSMLVMSIAGAGTYFVFKRRRRP
jgi:hypothetical protein